MSNFRNDWIIIGISGVTCGGKTTLANQLLRALSPVSVFHQDKYFFPDDSARHVRCDGLDHNNYDVLGALDMERMLDDVRQALRGEERAHAHGTDADHAPRAFQIPGKKFLVLEGFTVLNYKPLLDMCDLSYYFVLEFDECIARRVYRLYDPPDIAGYFEQCVWPEHIRYRAEIERDPRVKQLDGAIPNALDVVLADIRALGAVEVPRVA